MLYVNIGENKINLESFCTDDKHIYLNTYGTTIGDIDDILDKSDLSEIVIYEDNEIYSRFINYTKVCKLEKDIKFTESTVINGNNSGEAIEMIIVKITLELVDMSNKELKQNTKRVTEMQKTIHDLVEENNVLKDNISELELIISQMMLISVTSNDAEDDLANILLDSIKYGIDSNGSKEDNTISENVNDEEEDNNNES